MIKLLIVGQELSIVTKKVVSGTHDYLTVNATFRGDDWTDLRKWVHFTMGQYSYIIPMTDDAIGEEMHLDLTEGTWEVYVHGNELTDDEVTQRITTDIKYLYVEAPHDGHPFPPLTPEYEEILANLILEARDVWTRLWIATENGALGGPYFLPYVDEEGNISWTNNGGRDNPETRNIRGPRGYTGYSGVYIGTEEPTDPNVTVWINPEGTIGKVITGYQFSGNHTPGTYDHLIWSFSDGSTLDIPIYNGTDGIGTGDMLKSVYDPNNRATDIFQVITDAINALAIVARTGSYNDLLNKPDIPTVDDSLDNSSTNPVQNRVIKAALDGKQDAMTVDSAMSAVSTNPVQNNVIKQYIDSIASGLVWTIRYSVTITIPAGSVSAYADVTPASRSGSYLTAVVGAYETNTGGSAFVSDCGVLNEPYASKVRIRVNRSDPANTASAITAIVSCRLLYTKQNGVPV